MSQDVVDVLTDAIAIAILVAMTVAHQRQLRRRQVIMPVRVTLLVLSGAAAAGVIGAKSGNPLNAVPVFLWYASLFATGPLVNRFWLYTKRARLGAAYRQMSALTDRAEAIRLEGDRILEGRAPEALRPGLPDVDGKDRHDADRFEASNIEYLEVRTRLSTVISSLDRLRERETDEFIDLIQEGFRYYVELDSPTAERGQQLDDRIRELSDQLHL